MKIRFRDAPAPYVRVESIAIDDRSFELRSYYSCCHRWACVVRSADRVVGVGGGATLGEARRAAVERATHEPRQTDS